MEPTKIQGNSPQAPTHEGIKMIQNTNKHIQNIFETNPGSARGERPFSGGPIRPPQPQITQNKSRPNTAGK